MSTTPNPTYEIKVLGCKVNQYDAQQLRHVLEFLGLQPAESGRAPGLAVVHSCAVTANAMRKSLQAARKLKSDYPDAYVLITGCAVAVPDFKPPKRIQVCIAPHPAWLSRVVESLRTLPLDLGTAEFPAHADDLVLDTFSGHTRAFLKIQDGCSIGCSYCIVPSLRKAPRDKPLDVIIEEARALAEAGHREIVVSGVSVGLYGRHGGVSLAEVMRALAELPQTERLRLSSLHPGELTDELLTVWADSLKILPHVHLPLQSGSDRILEAMRRGYTRAEFLAAVARAKDRLERPSFTTDVIVGFPGESDGDFEDTISLCKAVGFSRMHVFPYSPRPGTVAAGLPGQVPGAKRNARTRRLRNLGVRLARRYHKQFEKKVLKVLVETWNPIDQVCEGYSERYVPVRFKGPESIKGSIQEVLVEKADADAVWGHV